MLSTPSRQRRIYKYTSGHSSSPATPTKIIGKINWVDTRQLAV